MKICSKCGRIYNDLMHNYEHDCSIIPLSEKQKELFAKWYNEGISEVPLEFKNGFED